MAKKKITESMNKLRFLVVGSGYFGQKRLQACSELKDHLTLVGLVDKDETKGVMISKQYNIRFAKNMADFASDEIDVAIISTPNNTHADLTIQALSKGWHVLCEKPLTPNVEQAEKIIEASQKYNKFVKTGSNHRFFPTVQKAYELFSKGYIGRILHFQASIGTNGALSAGRWFWNESVSGGGTFIDNACHMLDIARMFMGDFTSCVGYTANIFWKDTNVEDIGTGIFKKQNGTSAVISSSWIQWVGYMYFELWGEKGYIIVDSRGSDKVMYSQKDSSIQYVEDYTLKPKRSYHDEILYFLNQIKHKKAPDPTAKDGREVINMIKAVYTSSETGGWVNL